MTYCLAISVNEGIVFASDSRSNAGVDYIRTCSKMHRFFWAGDRIIVLLSAGNLATTQAVVNAIQRDLDDPKAKFNLLKAKHLFDVADYVGDLSQKEQHHHGPAIEKSGGSAGASFILGGQLKGQEHDIYLIYPEGNYISASVETPYLQIGENKYGKPILDRVITMDSSLNNAARCALVSLDSTMRSNISVGPPFELSMYIGNSLEEPRQSSLKLASPYYKSLQKSWNEGLKRAFTRLPKFDWE
ncbi:peptidase [Sedimenticola sp.]|uniref:peptidase n=1 Tax=Sedimenticola sp. TaxID=1940285 RepID=UPI002586A37F|nr:peptidase [Sedimenticola sp.]MCW8904202.1 peptidase [Sedimenticola sp.]